MKVAIVTFATKWNLLKSTTTAAYMRVSESTVNGVVTREFAERISSVRGFLAEVLEGGGQKLRKGGGQGVTFLHHLDGQPYYCKVYMPGKLRWYYRDLMGTGRAMAEWEANLRAHAFGIPTAPVLLAAGISSGLSTTHLFVTAPSVGVALEPWLLAGEASGSTEQRVYCSAQAVAWYHHIGFWHPHLHGHHLFWRDDLGCFELIDLENCQFFAGVPDGPAQHNVRQMARSIKRSIGQGYEQLFARAYQDELDRLARGGEAVGVDMRRSSGAHALTPSRGSDRE